MVTLLTSNALASEQLSVELFKESSTIKLSWNQKLHLYENTIGYLSTCWHLDKIIGKNVESKTENNALKLLTQGSYLKLSFRTNKPRFPIANEVQEVENIYVGIRVDGIPNLITENSGDVQLYGKCQGHYALLNYSCDTILSNLLDFKIDHKLCARLK